MNKTQKNALSDIFAVAWWFTLAFAWAGIVCTHVMRPIVETLERYTGNYYLLAGSLIICFLFFLPLVFSDIVTRLVHAKRA